MFADSVAWLSKLISVNDIGDPTDNQRNNKNFVVHFDIIALLIRASILLHMLE